jgi:hypothetical protein
MVVQVDVLMLILFEWSRKLLENKFKGGDLIWSKERRRKTTPITENPI